MYICLWLVCIILYIDKHIVIIDDLIQSGGTLYKCAVALKAKGAISVSAFVPHAVFPNNSWEKFLKYSTPPGKYAEFDRFWTTNSIPTTTTNIPTNDVFEILDISPQLLLDLDA